MNTAVLFLRLLCQKQLFTCVKCGAWVCVCVCARVHAPPSFRSSEAEGLTSALPEPAAPHHVASDNTPAHHSVPYFWFLFPRGCTCWVSHRWTLSVSSLRRCPESPRRSFHLGFTTVAAEPAWPNVFKLSCDQLSHTEHVLQPLVGSIPSAPDGSGVRAALTNNKLEQGEGKQQQYLAFLSSKRSFWTGK